MVTNFFADGVDYEVTTRGVNYGGNLWRQMYGDNYGASYVTFFVFARSAPLWQGSLGATLRVRCLSATLARMVGMACL